MLIFSAGVLHAQTSTSQMVVDDQVGGNRSAEAIPDLERELLPIDSIIAIAIDNSLFLKTDELLIERGKHQVAITKREWQRNIAAIGNYSIGNQRFMITGAEQTIQNNVLDGYRFGVGVNVPLYEITSRGKRVKMSKLDYQVTQNAKKLDELELRKEVIQAYEQLISVQKILRIQMENRENSLLMQQMGEKKFNEGTISLEEYGTVNEMAVNSEVSYENIKRDFHTMYYHFEILVGVPIEQLMRRR
jgi:outer membrane protein TolC